MADLRETIREIIREEIEAARQQSVNNRYKMVRVNNVLVPSAGKVYVVPVDNEATVPEIVVNRRVSSVEGLEVVVGVDNTSNVRQVLDIFDGEVFDQNDYIGQTFQPLHAPDHGWSSQTNPPFNNPAVDAVSVGQRGFVPLRARPAKAGGTKIDIEPFTYEFNDTWQVYPGSTSFDLTSNIPGTSGKQIFTLVYLDKTTNTILTVDSAESVYAKFIRPLFPTLPSGKNEPIALVRLYNGQTSINEAYDIYDVRRVVGTAESDEVGTVSKVYAPNLTTEVISTNASEQVGIGTTSPTRLLHIASGGATLPTGTNSGAESLVIQHNENTTDQSRIIMIAGNAAASSIDFGDDDDGLIGQILYHHNGDYIRFTTNNTEGMRITSAGEVGIGTDTPSKILHLKIGTGTTPSFSASPDGIVIQQNTNTTDESRIYLVAGTAGASSIDFGHATDPVIGQIKYDHTDDYMRFYTNNAEAVRIDSAGLVGINGVTSPSTELDIGDGAIEFADMTEPAAGAANTGRLYVKDNGAGKSQLCVRFATGAVQVLATEP